MTTQDADRTRKIAALTRQGYSAKDIAVQLRVTPRTVVRHRALAGVTEPRAPFITDAQLAQARRLMDDGCSREETARTVGISVASLTHHIPEFPLWSRAEASAYALARRDARRKGLL